MMSQKKRLFVLTGAGISAESGLATFRGNGGLWENHPIEEVASIDGYHRNPLLVQKFYNMRRRQMQDPAIQPNAAHRSLVELEERWPGEFLLVTQNVDDLHDRAGSKNLLHLHGELLKVRCQQSSQVFEWSEDILPDTRCRGCNNLGCMRPHIVWFGEMPLYMDRIYEYLEACDVFISIGTSGNVYPAAGFIAHAKANPSLKSFEANMEGTPQSGMFDEHFTGPATSLVPRLVQKILMNARN